MTQAQLPNCPLPVMIVSDDEEEDEEEIEEPESEPLPLPDHHFEFKKSVCKSGPKKGEEQNKVSLIIENHTFRRRREKNGHVTFTCNSCEAEKTFVSAIAKVIDGEYRLTEAPSVEEHVCWVSGDPQLGKSAISQMIQAIDRDPTRSINQIYEDVRLSFTESMSMEERKSFLQEFPTFKNVQRTLYKKRREMIPRNPATMKELAN